MFFCWLVAGQWEANSTACCFLSWRCRNYRVADSFRYGFQKGTESQIVQETATGLMLYINNECFSSIRRNYLGNVSSVNRFITWKSRNCVTGVAIWACLNCNIVDIWHMAKFILPVWESGTPSSSWLFVASSSLLAFENHLKRHHVSSQWSPWHTGFSGFLLLKGVVNNRQHYPVWECNDIFLGLSRIPFFLGGGGGFVNCPCTESLKSQQARMLQLTLVTAPCSWDCIWVCGAVVLFYLHGFWDYLNAVDKLCFSLSLSVLVFLVKPYYHGNGRSFKAFESALHIANGTLRYYYACMARWCICSQ